VKSGAAAFNPPCLCAKLASQRRLMRGASPTSRRCIAVENNISAMSGAPAGQSIWMSGSFLARDEHPVYSETEREAPNVH
jgi:hypothetical protein